MSENYILEGRKVGRREGGKVKTVVSGGKGRLEEWKQKH